MASSSLFYLANRSLAHQHDSGSEISINETDIPRLSKVARSIRSSITPRGTIHTAEIIPDIESLRCRYKRVVFGT